MLYVCCSTTVWFLMSPKSHSLVSNVTKNQCVCVGGGQGGGGWRGGEGGEGARKGIKRKKTLFPCMSCSATVWFLMCPKTNGGRGKRKRLTASLYVSCSATVWFLMSPKTSGLRYSATIIWSTSSQRLKWNSIFASEKQNVL